MDPIPLQSGIIYGPVRSRRLGWSLGLNASPTRYKLCSFNCVYCQYGWTLAHTTKITDSLHDFPTTSYFEQALETALREIKEVDNITFSGNGEATLHPQFEQLVDIAKQLRNMYFPKAMVGILSNSSTAGVEKVLLGLIKLDFRIMKLDAGDSKTFRKVNQPCKGISYEAILESLKSLKNITIQTMFVEGEIQNIGEQQIRNWIERIDEIRPLNVQIYSLHRPPAEPRLHGVQEKKLQEIAAQAELYTGVPVEVITTTSSYRTTRRYWN